MQCSRHSPMALIFLSTPSARRATSSCSLSRTTEENFYPRPPRGGRRHGKNPCHSTERFLSTPSARRATFWAPLLEPPEVFLSTPSARRATRITIRCLSTTIFLSTPSARRATPAVLGPRCLPFYFYPRPPRGGRQLVTYHSTPGVLFLSTPSARRATPLRRYCKKAKRISIHALREEGDADGDLPMLLQRHFYPRPPRGGRLTTLNYPRIIRKFLSTPSARRATTRSKAAFGDGHISIHALREEGDRHLPPGRGRRRGFLSTPSARRATGWLSPYSSVTANFYPRPPRGGRRRQASPRSASPLFLSTPSARRATFHVEGRPGGVLLFLSTPSARRATLLHLHGKQLLHISIHALREEGDACQAAKARPVGYFYPRPPRGGRQQKQRQNLYFQTNYTTFCTNLEEP